MSELEIDQRTIMTAQEVSDYLKIPLSTLYGLTKRKKIRGAKIGKHWRFFRREVENYLKHSEDQPLVPPPDLKDSDRRETSRINCELPAHLNICLPRKNERSGEGCIHNLGEHGALLVIRRNGNHGNENGNGEEKTDLVINDPVEMVFIVPGASPHIMRVEGRIIHRLHANRLAFGIKFKGLSRKDKKIIENYIG